MLANLLEAASAPFVNAIAVHRENFFKNFGEVTDADVSNSIAIT